MNELPVLIRKMSEPSQPSRDFPHRRRLSARPAALPAPSAVLLTLSYLRHAAPPPVGAVDVAHSPTMMMGRTRISEKKHKVKKKYPTLENWLASASLRKRFSPQWSYGITYSDSPLDERCGGVGRRGGIHYPGIVVVFFHVFFVDSFQFMIS